MSDWVCGVSLLSEGVMCIKMFGHKGPHENGKWQWPDETENKNQIAGVQPGPPASEPPLKLTTANGAFIPEVFEQVLVIANCGVAGHFRFQENGGNCIMCQRIQHAASSHTELRTRLREGIERMAMVLVEYQEAGEGDRPFVDGCKEWVSKAEAALSGAGDPSR